MTEKPNILLVILDSVRTQNMSVYNYYRKTTPFLEGFVDRSTLYTQARAPSIHSIASHVSMFTGKHAEEHGAIFHTAQIDTDQTIWRTLSSDFNYNTALFTNNKIISHASNVGDSFEYTFTPNFNSIRNRWPKALFDDAYYPGKKEGISSIGDNLQASLEDNATIRSLMNCTYTQFLRFADRIQSRFSKAPSSVGYKKITGELFVDAFLEWESEQSGSWATCLNLMDTHIPYEPESKFNKWAEQRPNQKFQLEELFNNEGWDRLESLEPLYDGTILQVDAIVRYLINELEQRGIFDETLIIITSDHGEGFGEQSRLDPRVRLKGHSWGIHEVLTHVPLIIKYPDQTGNQVVDQVVSLTDLPDLFRATAEDNSVEDVLSTSDIVLSSTYRMLKEDAEQYDSIDDVMKYVGPWRAVYENQDGAVRKHAKRKNDYITIDISNPSDVELISKEGQTRVDDVYDQFTETTVDHVNTSEIDEDLEEHLEDLGYIRG